VADILPGYRWNQRAARYVDNRTGRFVARSRILGLLDDQVIGAEQRLGELTTAYHEGRLSGSVWVEQMRTQLRRLHLQNAALGAGGWDRLGPREFGRVGGNLRADYQRLESFARDIQDGTLTIGQALNRTNLYIGNARVEFWEAERERVPAPGAGNVALERRMLGIAEHCEDCIDFYDQGWQRLGQLPPPGRQSVCLTNCKCRFERTEVLSSVMGEWIGTKRRT